MKKITIEQADAIAQPLRKEIEALRTQIAAQREKSFNKGVEAAAQIFDRRETEFYISGSEWDRTQIVSGSKYCVPQNGPAIACVNAEKIAKDIRGLKKATAPGPEILYDMVCVNRNVLLECLSYLPADLADYLKAALSQEGSDGNE